MTWPQLPETLLATSVSGTDILFDRQDASIHTLNPTASYAIGNRSRFAGLDHAAEELSKYYSTSHVEVANGLVSLESQLRTIAHKDGASGRTRFLPAPLAVEPCPSVPGHPDQVWVLDAIDRCIRITSYDRRMSTVLRHLLPTDDCSIDPTVHIDVWSDDEGVHIGLDGVRVSTDRSIETALSRSLAVITAATVDGSNLMLFHSAAVEYGGRVSLLVGSSGQGKTSTTLEMLRGGASYLTDEVAELEPCSGIVRGLRCPLGIEGPVRGRYPDLRPKWLGTGAEMPRWPVPPEAIGQTCTSGSLFNIAILDFSVDHRDAQVERLEPLQALTELCSHLFHPAAVNQTLLDCLVRRLGSIPCFKLRHGDSRSAADKLLQMLMARPAR